MAKLIYIAGKLNGDACEYNQNVHKMIKYGEIIRNMGCAVSLPCNDFLHGLVIGTHEYEDYFDNNLEILKRCDFVTLVPGWITSKGTRKEISEAKMFNIPVFYAVGLIPKWETKQWVLEEIKEAHILGISVLYSKNEIIKFINYNKIKIKPVGNASGTIKIQKIG